MGKLGVGRPGVGSPVVGRPGRGRLGRLGMEVGRDGRRDNKSGMLGIDGIGRLEGIGRLGIGKPPASFSSRAFRCTAPDPGTGCVGRGIGWPPVASGTVGNEAVGV